MFLSRIDFRKLFLLTVFCCAIPYQQGAFLFFVYFARKPPLGPQLANRPRSPKRAAKPPAFPGAQPGGASPGRVACDAWPGGSPPWRVACDALPVVVYSITAMEG